MTPDLVVLLAASLVALQIVALIARREHVADAPYLVLLVADLAALALVHATDRQGSMLAFVATGAAAVLALGPRILDALERGAVAAERFDRAVRIAKLRELVQPGRTAALKRRQIEDLRAVRSGGAGPVARRLREAAEEATDPARTRELREALATILFFDQRFAEGVDEVEAHLGVEYVAERPGFAAYLLRAYGELGRFDEMAGVMALIEGEDVPSPPVAEAPWLLAQVRATYLAYLGMLPHLEAVLAGEAGAVLPERARAFLLDVAHRRAGQPIPERARELADRVFERANRAQRAPEPRRRPRVTLLLIGLNLAAFALLAAQPAIDEGDLVRAGALFRPAVLAGEAWRLITATFLHAGWLHVAINMYGLYLLGRFVEQVFGPLRYLVVYVAGGLAGALASTFIGVGALSVGASGAIMGLLGALIVTLILRRGTWPETWRRALLLNLLFLGALQIFIGFQVPVIDNAAHVGGLLGGAAATLVFAPPGLAGMDRRGRVVVAVAAGLVAAALLASGILQALSPLPRTLARLPRREVTVGGVQVSVPRHWEVSGTQLEDPYLGLQAQVFRDSAGVHVVSPQDDDPRYRALLAEVRRSARAILD